MRAAPSSFSNALLTCAQVPYDTLKSTVRIAVAQLRQNEQLKQMVLDLEKGSSEETLVETLVDRLIEDPFTTTWETLLRNGRAAMAANNLISKVKGLVPDDVPLTAEAMVENADAVRKILPDRNGDFVLSAATFFKKRGSEFSAESTADMSDAELWGSEIQTQISGMGPTTMLVVLLKAYARLDVWPATDTTIKAFIAEQTTDADEQISMCETWRPYRGVAALLIWLCKVEGGLNGALEQTKD